MRNILLTVIASMSLSAVASAENGDWSSVQSWVYQLSNYRSDNLQEIAESPFNLAVIDLTRDGKNDYFSHEEIDLVKKTGKIVLAYFEIAAIEEYRPEWNAVPDDLKAGKVEGWPKEQYVKFWDERWWPIVKGRIDQALKAGFNGAYLDMVTTYEEIPGTAMSSEVRAHKMVDLIERISKYAKGKSAGFKIVPQNCPELFTWSYWTPKPNQKYIEAIDGLGLESVFYMAHDKPANKGWCRENRDNALAIKKAGKLVLGVDYAKKPVSIADAYSRQKELGFVPYVSVQALDRIQYKPESNKADARDGL